MPGETLRVVLGAAAGTEIELDDTFTLGRTESGDGSLGGDPELSRQHARIARSADGTLEITDLGSTNGTHVNGVRIADSHRLSPGDTIRVGQTTLNVHGEPAGPGGDSTVIGAAPRAFAEPVPPGEAAPPPPSFDDPAVATGPVPGAVSSEPRGSLPGPPAPPSPDPAPPSPTPEPGPAGPPSPDPAPPSPAPGPGPPGPPAPGPQIEEPGPFGAPSDEPVPEAAPPSPHGDPLVASAGLTLGDPLAGSPPPRPSPSPDPEGPHGDPFAAQVAAPPTGDEGARFDPPPGPPSPGPPPPAPPPFAAAPPPPGGPPVPVAPPGPAAPAGQPYPPAPPGAYAYGGPPAAAPAAGPPVPTAGSGASVYALKRPIGRQILLSILSFGIWGFYWYYDTRKKLNAELGKQDDAAVKTACMLIPIYNIILIYQLWEELNELRTRNFGLPEYNSAVLLIVAIIVPFGVFYSYPKIATELNQYWDVRTQGRATEAPVTTIEKVLAAVGAAILALYVLLIIILIIVAAAGS